MSNVLKPYPETKPSGLPWLGEIPMQWDIQRAKTLFKQMKRPVYESDEIVTCFRDGMVTLRKNRRITGFTNSLKEIGYQGVHKGDLVIHGMDAFAGAIGVSDSNGKSTPVYLICIPNIDLDVRYYSYVIREMARSKWILALARGIRERSTDFRFETFSKQYLPLPDKKEQNIISDFLDRHDRLVRRFIRNKRQLISLLNEQKQAIINQAVTRGLDPDVKLKPSGVEWLGDVPEHWEVKKLKFIASSIIGGSTPKSDQKDFWDGDVVWVTPEDISQASTIMTSARKITLAGLQSCSTRLVPSDSLVITSRAPVGNVAVAKVELCSNQGCKCIVPQQHIVTTEYLYYLLLVMKAELQSLAKGTTFTEISTFSLSSVKVPIPPLEEQQIIIHAITKLSLPVDTAIKHAEYEIDLIREYRTRLIANVVTGKVDVREAELPEVEGEEAEEIEGQEREEEGPVDDLSIDDMEDQKA